MPRPGVGPWRRNGFRGVGSASLWTPALLGAQVKLWLDQRDQVVTGLGVSDWGDQSPGGTVDFAQAVDASRPPQSTINGLAAPDFATLDHMTSAVNASVAMTAGAWEMFAVVSVDTLDADPASEGTPYTRGSLFYTQTGAGYGVTLTASGANLRALDSTYKSSGYAALAVSTPSLIACRHDTGTIYCQVGAGVVASAASAFSGSLATPINIGANYNASDGMDGRIGALIFTSVLAAADRSLMRTYLGTKYGVTV